jgi:hypothetical protein
VKLLNHVIELNFRARCKWTAPHLYNRLYYRHFVWGRVSLIFGQPHLEPVEIHSGCGASVRGIGEDLISYCEGCETIVEGQTEWVTFEEYEKGCL